jgi:hypothetical protein
MVFRLIAGCALVATASAQNPAPQVELANLREDVRGLVQRVGDLGLRVEQLERENANLRRKSADGSRAFATVAQLNEAVADLHRTLKTAVAASQNDTLQLVSTQLEKLGRQTNAAFDALGKAQTVRPITPPPATAAASSRAVQRNASTPVCVARRSVRTRSTRLPHTGCSPGASSRSTRRSG